MRSAVLKFNAAKRAHNFRRVLGTVESYYTRFWGERERRDARFLPFFRFFCPKTRQGTVKCVGCADFAGGLAFFSGNPRKKKTRPTSRQVGGKSDGGKLDGALDVSSFFKNAVNDGRRSVGASRRRSSANAAKRFSRPSGVQSPCAVRGK